MSKLIHYAMPRAGEIWRHSKGHHYKISHVGTSGETDTATVHYYSTDQNADYAAGGPDAVDMFDRSLANFLGWVKDGAGANTQRFTLVRLTFETSGPAASQQS